MLGSAVEASAQSGEEVAIEVVEALRAQGYHAGWTPLSVAGQTIVFDPVEGIWSEISCSWTGGLVAELQTGTGPVPGGYTGSARLLFNYYAEEDGPFCGMAGIAGHADIFIEPSGLIRTVGTNAVENTVEVLQTSLGYVAVVSVARWEQVRIDGLRRFRDAVRVSVLLTVQPFDTDVYFGNGVDNSRTEAKRSLSELENALHIFSALEFEGIDFKLAYNTTGGPLADFVESFIQDGQTDLTSFWRQLAGIEPMPESARAQLLVLVATLNPEALRTNQDLETHIALYEDSVQQGKKVIVVAHSQGNFFVNLAYPHLSQAALPSFGIVSVANPDSKVATNGPHTTLVEDLLIQAISRSTLGDPMPANISNLFNPDDWLGHSFTDAYLAANSSSREKILSDLVNVRHSLAAPPR